MGAPPPPSPCKSATPPPTANPANRPLPPAAYGVDVYAPPCGIWYCCPDFQWTPAVRAARACATCSAAAARARCAAASAMPAASAAGAGGCAGGMTQLGVIGEDSSAAPTLAMKQWEAGYVIRRLFNIRVEHNTRALTVRYLVAASLEVFI